MLYEDMSAVELRDERDKWTQTALQHAREYRRASQSPDFAWTGAMGICLDQALDQVDKITRLLRLGIAA